MSSDISPENQRFIDQEIEKGTFRSRAEAVDAGIGLLRGREELLARINRARAELDSGEFTEYDEEGLKSRFEELKCRATRAGGNSEKGG